MLFALRRSCAALLAELKATPGAVAATLIVPNVVFCLLAARADVPRAYFNLDYVLPALLSCIPRSRLAILGTVAAVSIISILEASYIAQDIAYLDLREFPIYFDLLSHWPWRQLLPVVALVFLLGALSFLSTIFVSVRTVPAIAIVATSVLLVVWDKNSPLSVGIDHDHPAANVAGSALRKVWHASSMPMEDHAAAFQSMLSQTAAELIAGSRHSLMSVAVESMGEPVNGNVRALILEPLDRLHSTYSITSGVTTFFGATLPGELRELCEVQIHGNPSKHFLDTGGPNCLPARMSRSGVRTVAVHGNTKLFYHRFLVYPAIGFGKTLFLEELRTHHTDADFSSVSGWRALLDKAVFADAMAQFHQGAPTDRTFVHVLTLDSHISPYSLGVATSECGALELTPAVCAHVIALRSVMRSLAEALESAPVPPQAVAIYGDHPPRLLSSADRRAFSDKEVLTIMLIRLPTDGGSALPNRGASQVEP